MSNNFSAVCTATKDAEVKTANSNEILVIDCANNQGFGDKRTSFFIRVSRWGKGAENIAKYIKKGTQIFISGEMSMREYQTKDGTTKTSIEVRANTVDLVGGRTEAPKPNQSPANNNDPNYDDDIPF